jgi:hypothetical protein
MSVEGSSYPWVNGQAPTVSYGTAAAAVRARIAELPHAIRDEDIERDKAGHRGLFLEELRGILDRCNSGDPDDPRWDELRLRTLDRFAKLARIFEPDAPTQKKGPGDQRVLADQASRALSELEASLSETRAS